MGKNKLFAYVILGGLFWYMIKKGLNPIEPEQDYTKNLFWYWIKRGRNPIEPEQEYAKNQASAPNMFPTDTMLPGALVPATQGIVKTDSGLSYMGCGCLGCGC